VTISWVESEKGHPACTAGAALQPNQASRKKAGKRAMGPQHVVFVCSTRAYATALRYTDNNGVTANRMRVDGRTLGTPV